MAYELTSVSATLLAATTAYIKRLKAEERGNAGASRIVLETLCAAFELTVIGETEADAFQEYLEAQQEGFATGSDPSDADSMTWAAKDRDMPQGTANTGLYAMRSPSGGEFEYTVLFYLAARDRHGATRDEIMDLFYALGFDVGKPSAFATRLNTRLKGGKDNTIGYVTWTTNAKHPSASVTEKGLEWLAELERCEASGLLSLKERDQLRPRLEKLVARPPNSSGAS